MSYSIELYTYTVRRVQSIHYSHNMYSDVELKTQVGSDLELKSQRNQKDKRAKNLAKIDSSTYRRSGSLWLFQNAVQPTLCSLCLRLQHTVLRLQRELTVENKFVELSVDNKLKSTL